jgi:hypothetical protein
MILIYSCKKRLNQAEQLYDMLFGERYIVYGDDVDDYVLTERHLILNVEDSYEKLTEKTMKMFQVVSRLFPGKGILKMDDDIIPTISHLKKTMDYFENQNMVYAGNVMTAGEYMSSWHINKVTDKTYNIPMLAKACTYATGPIYYVGPSAIPLLHQLEGMYEDIAVGVALNVHSIYPEHVSLYSNNLSPISYHNHCDTKKIYLELHSRLGNQLFQVASAYGIAKKHNRFLIIVSHRNTYTETFFKDFNIIQPKHLPSMHHYKESDNKQCFQYNDSILSNDNVTIHGYLQTEKYFQDYRQDILSFFKRDMKLLNAYFIHVRRGDYVNNSNYTLDYDTYYQKAIDHLGKNNHYYIVSDDISYCKQYPLFETLQKTFVEDTDINSLYLMSSCTLGGICSNSTFSWWGSYLIENPNKKVIFPSTWMNNGQDNKDVYPENAILL